MRLTEKNGRQVAPGVWQLNRDMFIVRAQPVDALTGRKRNVRRVLHGATLGQALLAREQLLDVEPTAPLLPVAPLPAVPLASPVQPVVSGPTLGTFAEEWLKRKVKRGDLEGSTRRRYELAIARLSQELVRCPLEQVRPAMVENWMLASREGDPSYSSVTINSWRQVLRTILNDAVIQGLVTVNVVSGTRPLRVRWTSRSPTRSRQPSWCACCGPLRTATSRWPTLPGLRPSRACGGKRCRPCAGRTSTRPSAR